MRDWIEETDRREWIEQFERRTKKFTVDAIRLCVSMERLPGLRRVTWQLIDSAGSVGSNHRAMRRSRSDAEFAAKLQIVNEEADESAFWLEVCSELYPNHSVELTRLTAEAIELRSVFA